MKRLLPVKSGIIALLIIGAILGIGGTYFGHSAVKATSDAAFCGSCHVMNSMVAAYERDVHSGISTLGIRTQCVDCHLPHDHVTGYLYQKAVDGIRDVYVNSFGNPSEIDWHARRDQRARYVYDSGCLRCHETVIHADNENNKNARAHEMHALYTEHSGKDEAMQCVSCHTSVGHRQLGHLIEEAFGPPDYGTWK